MPPKRFQNNFVKIGGGFHQPLEGEIPGREGVVWTISGACAPCLLERYPSRWAALDYSLEEFISEGYKVDCIFQGPKCLLK